jgi:hypothetical protein
MASAKGPRHCGSAREPTRLAAPVFGDAENNFRFNLTNNVHPKRIFSMKMKPMIVAGIAAGLLCSGSAVAAADPGPPQPGPDTPMCWESTPDGWMHAEYVPCGWHYDAADGWQQNSPPAPH